MKKPRRAISVREDTYDGAAIVAKARGVSLSSIVEDHLRGLASLPPVDHAASRMGQKPRPPGVEMRCESCNSVFYQPMGKNAPTGDRAFCSNKCASRAAAVLSVMARNPRGKNPDDVSPAKINADQARLAIAKNAARRRALEAMINGEAGVTRAELPPRHKVDRIEAPKPYQGKRRDGVPGAF